MRDSNETTGCTSLAHALAVFGYSDAAPSHHRYNLLSAIALFAALNGRPQVGAACEAMMTAISDENAGA